MENNKIKTYYMEILFTIFFLSCLLLLLCYNNIINLLRSFYNIFTQIIVYIYQHPIIYVVFNYIFIMLLFTAMTPGVFFYFGKGSKYAPVIHGLIFAVLYNTIQNITNAISSNTNPLASIF